MGQASGSPGQGSMMFSPQEINKLYKRFKMLDREGNGELRPEDFYDIPALAQNPLIQRVITIFAKERNGRVSFVQFIKGLEIFSAGASEQEKLQFAFRVYDTDDDGIISAGDLFLILKLMVGSNLSDAQLHQLVDRTMKKADLNVDGRISFDEFVAMVHNLDVAKKLTLTYE